MTYKADMKADMKADKIPVSDRGPVDHNEAAALKVEPSKKPGPRSRS